MSDDTRSGPGAFLFGLGIAIFAFAVLARALDWRLGPVLGFLEGNLFLPIILVLVGRGMMRRSRIPTPTTVPAPRPPPATRPPRTQPPTRPRPPGPTYQVPDFPEPTPAPKPAPEPEASHTTAKPSPMPAPPSPRPAGEHAHPVAAPATPAADSHHGKTSKEMIAEAKDRLRQKKG